MIVLSQLILYSLPYRLKSFVFCRCNAISKKYFSLFRKKCRLSLYSFLRLLIDVEGALMRGRDRAEQSHAFWKNVQYFPEQSLIMPYSCRAIQEWLGCLRCLLGRGLSSHHQQWSNSGKWIPVLRVKGLRMSESLCAHAHVPKLSRRIYLFDCKTCEPTQSELV